VSGEYFDKYLFESDPELLRAVAEALVSLLPSHVDAVAGLELGGVPLATMVSQLSGLPVLFVRKAPKDYGTRRLAEGGEVAGRRLAVIEDVVTSGSRRLSRRRARGSGSVRNPRGPLGGLRPHSGLNPPGARIRSSFAQRLGSRPLRRRKPLPRNGSKGAARH